MNIKKFSFGCAFLAASVVQAATVDFPGAGGDLATSTAGVGDTIRLVNNGTYSLSEDKSFLSMAFSNTVTEAAFDFGSASRKLTLSPTEGWLNMFGTDNAVGSFVGGEINITTDKNIGLFRSGMKNGTATFGKDFFYNAPKAEFVISQYGKDNTLTITDGAKLTANIITLANNDVSGITLNIEKGSQVESKMRVYTGKNGAGGYVGRNRIVVSGENTLLKYSGAYRFCVGFNKKYDGVIVKDGATVDSKIFQLGSGDNGSCAYLDVSNGADFTCTSLEFNGNASTATVDNASFACKDGTKDGTFLFKGADSAFIVKGSDSSLTLPSFGANNAKPLDLFGAGHRQLFSLEDGAKWHCRFYALATNTTHSVFRVSGTGSTFGDATNSKDFYFGTCWSQWNMPISFSNRVEILDGAEFNVDNLMLGGHYNEVVVSNATLNATNGGSGLRIGYQADVQAEGNRLVLRGAAPTVRVTCTTGYRCVFARGGTLRYEIPAEGYAADFVPLTCSKDFAMVEGDLSAGIASGKLEIACDDWADAAEPGAKLTLLRAGSKLSNNFKNYVKNTVASTLPESVRVIVTDYEIAIKKRGGFGITIR